ncbi:MAG: DUF3800 domain-containing protein [Clostridiales Family XIII bacterium]|jgi:predicted alpha-1,6-mannanase (GH76 family)|nr:DUF3800 domain-containing protein [Clostridiales Family XIII bacterium]
MTYLYFDESGNFGLDFDNPTVSRHFYLTFSITDNPKEIEKVIKNVIASSKHTKRFRGYLHSADDKDETLMRGLRYLARKNIRVACMRVDKKHLPLNTAQDVIYKKLVLTLIKRLFENKILKSDEKYKFIASRYYSNKRLNREFIEYIFENTSNINIETEWSRNDKCLQATDYFGAAFYRKYEKNDDRFYNIIEDIIVGNYSR